MTKLTLEVGDRVWVYTKGLPAVLGTLVHKPQGAGDMWGFQGEDTGLVSYFSPYYSDFVGFVKVDEDDLRNK